MTNNLSFKTILVVASILLSLNIMAYEKIHNGIIIHPTNNQSKSVRLEVVTDKIIRVSATANEAFSGEESLMIIPVDQQITWDVTEDNNLINLNTSSITASVNKITGEVIFKDKMGKVILQENTGGGKFFQKFKDKKRKEYSIQQIFESDDDEAFYGLGQHQADEFNYKGKNEILFQYNTKVAVPFIVSSKNYGLLWDNNSVTKFGDVRDYENLDQFKLYDKNGKSGGLTATYYTQNDEIFVTRHESKIDYENLETVKNFPAGFSFDHSKITWEGEIEPNETGFYRFILYYAGYTKVFIDGEEVVSERWRTAWNPNSYKFKSELTKGNKHKIKIEWIPDGGVSYISLKALSPRPDKEQNQLSLSSEVADEIDYYFIYGNNIDNVISGYRTITGKSPIMPKWAMGFWQSRERYKTQDEVLETVAEYRKRQIPLDNIVQDWSYWRDDAWGSHEFDPSRFPDPKAMIDSIHAMDAKIMISVWPKFYHTTDNYKAFDRNGWMYNKAVKDSIRDWIGEGYIAGFYDAYSDGARKLFWKQMSDKLYSKGIDAWWMDASEPDILSNASIEYRKELMNPTALGESDKYFNAYALANAKAIYEGQRSENPNDRVFLLTRSGFGGLQRYSTATWSGDIGTRWEDMKAQISAGLNFALSGIPYWTMDIGGFCVEKRYETAQEGSEDLNEWRELNTRWFQFGAFCPLFRSHGQYPYREIYNIAPDNHPAYQSMVYYTNLRYQLMPYIYTLAGKTYFDDYTIMRALVMDFNEDKNVHNISDQYMFGPSIMVCPVYEYGNRRRDVYFPANSNWYDFESNTYITGGQSISVDAPYERIPLYVKAGSIIPMGNIIQSTEEPQSDNLILRVYSGKDGNFTIYEDENTNYNYEKDAYATIDLKYNDQNKTLNIGATNGYYDGIPKERNIEIQQISENGVKTFNLKYRGENVEIDLN